MATVAELAAGDLVSQGGTSAVFVSCGVHPVWPALMLVIWRLGWDAEAGGTAWSFDALDLHQEVGDVAPSTSRDRQARLLAALLGNAEAK